MLDGLSLFIRSHYTLSAAARKQYRYRARHPFFPVGRHRELSVHPPACCPRLFRLHTHSAYLPSPLFSPFFFFTSYFFPSVPSAPVFRTFLCVDRAHLLANSSFTNYDLVWSGGVAFLFRYNRLSLPTLLYFLVIKAVMCFRPSPSPCSASPISDFFFLYTHLFPLPRFPVSPYLFAFLFTARLPHVINATFPSFASVIFLPCAPSDRVICRVLCFFFPGWFV